MAKARKGTPSGKNKAVQGKKAQRVTTPRLKMSLKSTLALAKTAIVLLQKLDQKDIDKYLPKNPSKGTRVGKNDNSNTKTATVKANSKKKVGVVPKLKIASTLWSKKKPITDNAEKNLNIPNLLALPTVTIQLEKISADDLTKYQQPSIRATTTNSSDQNIKISEFPEVFVNIRRLDPAELKKYDRKHLATGIASANNVTPRRPRRPSTLNLDATGKRGKRYSNAYLSFAATPAMTSTPKKS